MGEIDPQEFGRLQAQVEALVKADEERGAMLHEVHTGMCALREMFAEARGGWKIIISIGTAAATLGACVWDLLGHFKTWLGS